MRASRVAPGLLAAAVAAIAATPPAAPAQSTAQGLTAPGRVVMPSLGWEIAPNPDAGGGGRAVQLPDGSALVLADFDGHGRALHRLHRDGTFELRGPLQLPDTVRSLPTHGIALDAQGRVLISFEWARPEGTFEFNRLLVVRVGQDGALDTTFGAGGVADPGVNLGCGACEDLAAAADGSVLVTGTIGGSRPTQPGEPSRHSWAVARLTADGRRDTSFDGDGIVTLAPQSAAGFNVAPLPDGRVAVLGQESLLKGGARLLLARLTVTGAPDASYGDGDGLVETPFFSGFEWLVRDDGTVLLPGFRRDITRMVPSDELTEMARYTPAGTLDQAFDGDGLATLGSITPRTVLAERDGVVLVLGEPRGGSRGRFATPYSTITDTRVGPDGAVTSSGRYVVPAFGGGIQTGSLSQNSLFIGDVLRRPDGTFLVTGGLSVVIYTGEGEGRSVGAGAYASLTPQLAPDPTFGGPARTPRLRISVPRQRAATVRRTRRILVRLDAERPSLTRVTVRVEGRAIGTSTLATLRPGWQTHRVLIPRAWTRRARAGRVTVDARVMDLVRTTRGTTARGRLR